ncbi:MAG TPA: NAD(P)H-binding protein [Bacteroidales bacterium]|nr:NAD(P)H-binding protein [Bacteroidales bacterium]
MKPLKKIAVLGGTGKAGRFLTELLISREYQVKLLARDPGKVNLSDPLIEIVTGNAKNYESVFTLLQGCDAVINTLGPSRHEPDTCSIATGHVIKAMQTLHRKRYIELAGLAIDTPEDNKGLFTRLVVGFMRFFFPAIINDRQKGYRLLMESNLDWTIVRSSMIELTDSRRTIKTSLEDSPGRKVSSTTLALFMIDHLTDTRYIRKCPFVAS